MPEEEGGEASSSSTLTEIESPWSNMSEGGSIVVPLLVIAWSAVQPARVGESAHVPIDGSIRLLGRGGVTPQDHHPRLLFRQERPGSRDSGGDLLGPQFSRRQALVRMSRGAIEIENIGACPMRIDGVATKSGRLKPGSTVLFVDQLLLICIERQPTIPRLRSWPESATGEFGQPDLMGMVGESPTAWRQRDEIAFMARAKGHVLILGESGVGKEVAAAAVHRLSDRGRQALVSRSAATFPDTLIDAELFGNVANFPNPGMRERPGLLGEADGSTLLLDEIGELPVALQARLLRVLDSEGEYSRLGEAKSRRADFRLVAATNRSVADLKSDFAARFTLRLQLEGLNERREDVPLLILHLLRRIANENPDVRDRFFCANGEGKQFPRIAPQLVDTLIRHNYTLHVRELEGLLWRAILSSPGDFIGLSEEVLREMEPDEQAESGERTSVEVSEEAVRDALERTGHNVSRASRLLGLKNRYVLYRLMARYGLR